MRLLLLIASFFLVFSTCKSDKKTDSKGDSTSTAEMSSMTKKYKLTPFTPSPEFKDAKIKSPALKYENGTMTFNVVEGTSYQLGAQTADAKTKGCANSAKGQHLHVLVDSEPYAARYTASFDDVKIEDGNHNLLAFLSRSYHESIKTAYAHVALKVNAKDGSFKSQETIKEPMIWYSRPKGKYVGKANTDKVMLDFYLINTDLKNGNKVKADINGEVHMLDTWQPYFIEGLPMGENTITLSLMDKDGKLMKAEQNPIARTFTLSKAIEEQ